MEYMICTHHLSLHYYIISITPSQIAAEAMSQI